MVSTKKLATWRDLAPVRRFLPDLIELIMSDQINPGEVFDLTFPPEARLEAYVAMDEQRAAKVLLTTGT